MEEGNDIWQLFVKGLEGKTMLIRIHKDATVDELINKISERNNIPPDVQRILYTTKQLEYGAGKYLSDYHMHDNCTLFVVLRLHGGGNSMGSTNSEYNNAGGNNTRSNSTGGNNTGGNNTGGNNTGGNNNEAINTEGDNTEGNNIGVDNTGGNNTGGNNTRGSNTTSPPRKELDEDVETTEAPDMISWEDDPNTPRAKMSCGHAITPETLTTYCESLLSAGKYIFKCPYISPTGEYCGKEWSYLEVRRLAVLNADEKKQFETKISDNYLRKGMGIQECPKCHSMCERVDKKDKRVVCPLCSARGTNEYHFCWHCLHEWVGSGIDRCGNDDCSGEDKRLKILRDCNRKTIVGVAGCPAIRACLKCGMLIEHDRACKHMVCTCGQKFCFICLKPAVNGRYQCGTYNSPCKIANVQTTIPGDN
ncbi:UBC [Branchiostoma lanceolatum]|uniref:UBC protein n=1 Tax=Branchiostoma lanceolatum TaxID=7740 RepID=A0A8J9YJT0_BRALA|nr:UBC [Branchiostoma lanceolatum]